MYKTDEKRDGIRVCDPVTDSDHPSVIYKRFNCLLTCFNSVSQSRVYRCFSGIKLFEFDLVSF